MAKGSTVSCTCVCKNNERKVEGKNPDTIETGKYGKKFAVKKTYCVFNLGTGPKRCQIMERSDCVEVGFLSFHLLFLPYPCPCDLDQKLHQREALFITLLESSH